MKQLMAEKLNLVVGGVYYPKNPINKDGTINETPNRPR